MKTKYFFWSKVLSWLYLAYALGVIIYFIVDIVGAYYSWLDGLSHNDPTWRAGHSFPYPQTIAVIVVGFTFLISLIYTVSFNGWFLRKNQNSFCQAFIFQKYNASLTLDKYQCTKAVWVTDIDLTGLISVGNLTVFGYGFVIFSAGWSPVIYLVSAIWVPAYFIGINISRLVMVNRSPLQHVSPKLATN